MPALHGVTTNFEKLAPEMPEHKRSPVMYPRKSSYHTVPACRQAKFKLIPARVWHPGCTTPTADLRKTVDRFTVGYNHSDAFDLLKRMPSSMTPPYSVGTFSPIDRG